MFELNVGGVLAIGLLTLFTIFSDALRRAVDILDVEITSWSLKRRGVKDEEIRKIALAKIRRRRQNPLIRILKMLLDFLKK